MSQSKPAQYLLFAGCYVLYFLPFLRVLSHNGDEGTLILGATRVAAGELPFRDFFEVMGPGAFYSLALFFKVLGTSWLTTRIFLLVTTLAIALLLFHLAHRLRTGFEALPVLFFVAVSYHSWNAVSHHMDSNLLALLGFACFYAAVSGGSRRLLLAAGAAAGVTACIMLPKGLLLCASFLAALFLLERRDPRLRTDLARVLGSFLAVVTTVILLFWRAGGLGQMVYANLVWPLTNYRGTNQVPYGMEFRQLYWESFTASAGSVCSATCANLVSGFLSTPFIAVMALPLVLGVAALCLRRSAFTSATWPFWICGSALWISEMHRKDVAHIVFGSPLLIVLAFWLIRKVQSRWAGAGLQLIAVSAGVLALMNPLVALVAPHHTVTRRGPAYDAFPENPVLGFIEARVRPGEPVFVYPYAPMYYFLSAAENPTRYSILMYQINTAAQFREAVDSLERRQVRYVVWDRSFVSWVNKWFPAYRIPPQDELIMEPYLTQHYNVIGGEANGYQFLERKPAVATALGKPQEEQIQ